MKKLFLFSLFIFFAYSCSDNPPQQPTTGTVNGTVQLRMYRIAESGVILGTFFLDSALLDNIPIYFISTEKSGTFATHTDKGKFVISNLPNGKYKIYTNIQNMAVPISDSVFNFNKGSDSIIIQLPYKYDSESSICKIDSPYPNPCGKSLALSYTQMLQDSLDIYIFDIKNNTSYLLLSNSFDPGKHSLMAFLKDTVSLYYLFISGRNYYSLAAITNMKL